LFCGSAELPQGLKPLLVLSVGSAKAEALAYLEAKAERFSVQVRALSRDSSEQEQATARATANTGVSPLRVRKKRERFGRDDRVWVDSQKRERFGRDDRVWGGFFSLVLF